MKKIFRIPTHFHIKLSKLALALCLMLLAGQAWGATYYVDAAMADDTGNGLSWATAKQKIASAVTLGNTDSGGDGPHTIYIFTGSYTDGMTITDADWAGGTIIGVNNKDTLAAAKFDEVVVIPASTDGVFSNQANQTIRNLSIKTTASGKSPILITTGATNFAVYNCKLYDSVASIFNATGTVAGWSVNNCLLDGVAAVAGLSFASSASGTFNNCVIRDSATTTFSTYYPFYNTGTGVITVNNCVISATGVSVGGGYGIFNQTGADPGKFVIRNCIIGPTSPASYLFRVTAGSIDYDYNMLIPDFSLHRIATGTVTDGGHNLVTANPRFTHREKSGFIMFEIDDLGATPLAYVQSLEAPLAAYGYKATWNIHSSAVSTYAADIIDLISRGTIEIGSHGMSHSDLTKTTAMTCTKNPGNIQVDRAGDQIIATPGGTIAAMGSKILGTTVLAGSIIKSLTDWGYTCTLTTSVDANVVGDSLNDVNASTAAGLAIPLLVDNTAATGFLHNELVHSKSVIETALSITLKQLSTPFGTSNADVKAAVKAAGYEGMRIIYTSAGAAGWTLSSIDLFGLQYISNYTFKGASDAELVNNMHAICQYAATRGAALIILAHSTAELTVDQWNLVFGVVSQYPEITVDSTGGVIARLKASPWTYTGATGISTRTWTDLSNYNLRAGSPAIDAGTPVFTAAQWLAGGDAAGNHYVFGAGPDIGAFERKKFWEPDDGEWLPKKCKTTNAACYVQP